MTIPDHVMERHRKIGEPIPGVYIDGMVNQSLYFDEAGNIWVHFNKEYYEKVLCWWSTWFFHGDIQKTIIEAMKVVTPIWANELRKNPPYDTNDPQNSDLW
jgi:hypothetical protein